MVPRYRRSPNFGSQAETSFSTVPYAADPTTAPASSSYPSSMTSPNPAASPPLVLAFLAVGLFTAALITVFGCRRVTLGQRWAANHRAIQVVGIESKVEDRPRLWDLGAVPVTIGPDRGWKDIMPVAAHKTIDVVTENRSDQVRALQGGALDILLRGIDNLRHALPLRGYSVTPTTSERLRAESRARLQVAVPIAMPCQQRRDSHAGDVSATKEDEKTDVVPWADDRLVYSIGLFEVPWREPASDGW